MENFFKNSERLNAVNYFRKKASVDVLLCSKHASGIYKEIFWKTNFLRNYSSNVFECLVFEIIKRIPIYSNDLKSLFIDVGHGFKYVFHITCKMLHLWFLLIYAFYGFSVIMNKKCPLFVSEN